MLIPTPRALFDERNVDCPAASRPRPHTNGMLVEEMGNPRRGVLEISVTAASSSRRARTAPAPPCLGAEGTRPTP